ncbi:MAG: cob(I)yrinic acid a,c-diamide adenosyltransferase [candidate division Zixibacteria bacterium]|nr:cob(I)yrinic acid a,c-diamide adenosyltransferase [candidate division Zixibacteria bacterium]
MAEKQKKTGLIIVYTGDGKGKTTAALGICLRAAGYDMKAAIVQFVKGSWHCGELDGIKKLSPNVEIFTGGKGFVGISDDNLPHEEHVKAAQDTLKFAEELIASGKYDIIILDELNVAVSLRLIDIGDVLTLLDKKPDNMDIVITGRDAHRDLIERADLVTEMKEIKHPFNKGVIAQKGIDY